MKGFHSQRGIGLFNIILVLLIISFFATFAAKVVPIYAENRYVTTGLANIVPAGTSLNQMSDNEIRKRMSDYYLINAVRGEGPNNIKISRKSDHVLITIDYETRVSFMYNIDLVIGFKNHLDSSYPGKCCDPQGIK